MVEKSVYIVKASHFRNKITYEIKDKKQRESKNSY